MELFTHLLHGFLPLLLGMVVTAPNPERAGGLEELVQEAEKQGIPVMEMKEVSPFAFLEEDGALIEALIPGWRLEEQSLRKVEDTYSRSLPMDFYAEEAGEEHSHMEEEQEGEASYLQVLPLEEWEAALPLEVIGEVQEVVELSEEEEGTSQVLEILDFTAEESSEAIEPQTEQDTEAASESQTEQDTEAASESQTEQVTEATSESQTETRALEPSSQEKLILKASDIKPRKKLRKAMKKLPESAQIKVETVMQMPELPTGCESVALTIALHALGFELGKTEIADRYLIYDSYNYILGYVGNPYSWDGAGVFPPGLVHTANKFFIEKESKLRAYDATGYTLEQLLPFVAIKKPVLLWVTMYYGDPYMSGTGLTYEGKTYEWYQGEHCVALTGYDLNQRTVTLCDPLQGTVVRGMDEIQGIMNTVGSYGVVFY